MKTSEQMQKMTSQPGFVAALDQSGGSTPHALALYGIKDHAWKDDDEMFALVHQQFEVAERIIDTGLVPIIEPEVDIHCPQKARAEALLKEAILEKLNGLPAGQQVMLKLTLPEQADFYADCVRHPRVVRVLALSGGYTQEEADARLRQNHGVVASFSRALLEGLSAHQTDAVFNAVLDASIQRIYEASIT